MAHKRHVKPIIMAVPPVVAENRSMEASGRSFMVVVFCLCDIFESGRWSVVSLSR